MVCVGESGAPGEWLSVGEVQFSVVGTVLMLIKMMVEYCQCVVDIPTAAPDLLTRLIDLLKVSQQTSHFISHTASHPS